LTQTANKSLLKSYALVRIDGGKSSQFFCAADCPTHLASPFSAEQASE